MLSVDKCPHGKLDRSRCVSCLQTSIRTLVGELTAANEELSDAVERLHQAGLLAEKWKRDWEGETVQMGKDLEQVLTG